MSHFLVASAHNPAQHHRCYPIQITLSKSYREHALFAALDRLDHHLCYQSLQKNRKAGHACQTLGRRGNPKHCLAHLKLNQYQPSLAVFCVGVAEHAPMSCLRDHYWHNFPIEIFEPRVYLAQTNIWADDNHHLVAKKNLAQTQSPADCVCNRDHLLGQKKTYQLLDNEIWTQHDYG